MAVHTSFHRAGCALFAFALAFLGSAFAHAPQQATERFGGVYSGLDSRRQRLIDDWVARFNEVTGQKVDAGSFYDGFVKLSSKTTFDAVTNALMTTPLTDESGRKFGDALDLVERVESVRGEVPGASGDRQFRMYALLEANAIEMLERSEEFERGVDNTVYHRGYPINYRQQGGVPSIQVSIARDGRRADIDVDYRSSSFPGALFNGHLSSSNSDVRAGNNYDRHIGRWAGFQNWWRSFFGIRIEQAPEDATGDPSSAIPREPRAGKKTIEVMVNDFLTAWLVEGDIVAAMGYVSDRAYACLAEEGDDPSAIDRGMAPFQILIGMKAAHDALGKHDSLDGLTVGVNLALPALKLVDQPHHPRFVLYSVPDDVAARFDCESRLRVGDLESASREYGRYFGATFYVNSPRGRDTTVALLWAEESGYWKIVSWQADPIEEMPDLAPAPETEVVRIDPEPALVVAAKDFLESWLVRKDYEAAFRYLSPKVYACYDLLRGANQPAAASLEDAGNKIRTGLERAGDGIGTVGSLDAIVSATEPFHPAVRVMNHPDARTFALTSVPDAIAEAADCAARAGGKRFIGDIPLEYGNAFGMNVRFKTRAGDAPVLRLLWIRENGAFRIAVYDVELP